jgi:hypothetical protein
MDHLPFIAFDFQCKKIDNVIQSTGLSSLFIILNPCQVCNLQHINKNICILIYDFVIFFFCNRIYSFVSTNLILVTHSSSKDDCGLGIAT